MRGMATTPEPAAGYELGTGGLVFIGIYVLSLIGIGWLGHRAKRADTLEDHYLGGRGFGLGVLFLTLYATQYSGNSFMGFVGKAYREGFPFLSGVVAMMAVVGGYFLYAPRLHRRSQQRGYVTLGDYVQDRFKSRLYFCVGKFRADQSQGAGYSRGGGERWAGEF